MIFEIGQHVKCLLKNNIMAEGIVEEWAETGVRLKSLEDNSILIILHPNEDIILIKIIIKPLSNKSNVEKIADAIRHHPIEIKNDLGKKFQQVYEQPSDNNFRLKKMAELKVLLAEQERKIVADKIKKHHTGDVKEVKYEYPGFITKPRA